VADVPFINGNNDDEGTLFSWQLTNLVTDDETLAYIHDNYLPNANQSTMEAIAKLYPSDLAAGSPFDTGSANAITPQFKRLSAFQGDLVFQGPRRLLIDERASKQPVWSFLNKRSKSTKYLGTFHASDLLQTFIGHAELQDYLINFINHFDPNGRYRKESGSERGSGSEQGSGSELIYWPRFSPVTKELLTILDDSIRLDITKDDFRKEAIDFLVHFTAENPT